MSDAVSKEEGQAIVERSLNQGYSEPGDSLVILEDETIEKPYGWVFFYQSSLFLKTGDFEEQVIAGPVVFCSVDRSVHLLGTANGPEQEVAEFERKMGLR